MRWQASAKTRRCPWKLTLPVSVNGNVLLVSGWRRPGPSAGSLPTGWSLRLFSRRSCAADGQPHRNSGRRGRSRSGSGPGRAAPATARCRKSGGIPGPGRRPIRRTPAPDASPARPGPGQTFALAGGKVSGGVVVVVEGDLVGNLQAFQVAVGLGGDFGAVLEQVFEQEIVREDGGEQLAVVVTILIAYRLAVDQQLAAFRHIEA